MARRGALALASWATATVVASITSVAGISMVTTQVTRAPLPSSSGSTAPAAQGAVPVAVTPVGTDSSRRAGGGLVHATFGSPSGVVTVGCDGGAISLTSAAPAPGHRFTVVSSGPEVIEVAFAGTRSADTRIVCVDGHPVEQEAGAPERSGDDGEIATESPSDGVPSDRGHDGPIVAPWDGRRADEGDQYDHHDRDDRRGDLGADGWERDYRGRGEHTDAAAATAPTEDGQPQGDEDDDPTRTDGSSSSDGGATDESGDRSWRPGDDGSHGDTSDARLEANGDTDPGDDEDTPSDD